ncbi:putative ATPase [Herbihabitans rhizosphaerae]|uniref:Putative ATPase n=1 Tax=Herbihabitans rhizosphaerae TaxID=1872711 RepID=A0A4Q7L4Q1_9PSEU|nr:AAA family ATPase [Herbihabitans rhizosphaerae]RZS43192.1 putative ATPase [Herbihabitans rhizosphaerae]
MTMLIDRLSVRNYRVLRDVTLSDLTPLTVLLGPNGSGKSTVLDTLAFLAEAVEDGLGTAVGARGGFGELRTFGSEGPVAIELDVRSEAGRFHYRLSFDSAEVPIDEILSWQSADSELRPLLEFRNGNGVTYDENANQESEVLADASLLALDTFGRINRYREIAELRRFILRWRQVNIEVARVRAGAADPGEQYGLFSDGSNLASAVARLWNSGPDAHDELERTLRKFVPKLDSVALGSDDNGWLIVQTKDFAFEQHADPDAVSEGTLRLLAQLVALRQPRASALMVEEPENNVHPRMHYRLAEEFRFASADRQVLVATHAPRFVDAVRPDELWALYRDDDGYARVRRAADEPRLMAMLDAGGSLGELWAEGYFRGGIAEEDSP